MKPNHRATLFWDGPGLEQSGAIELEDHRTQFVYRETTGRQTVYQVHRVSTAAHRGRRAPELRLAAIGSIDNGEQVHLPTVAILAHCRLTDRKTEDDPRPKD